MNNLLSTDNRNLFIDFLKGFCIICVILAHNLPPAIMKASVFVAWGSMAVPIFLIIQSYHIFKRDEKCRLRGLESKSKINYDFKKLWKRIIKPFLACMMITGIILLVLGHEPIRVLKSAIHSGGIGPGSYYVWIYLQFFLLLPLCLKLINKWGGEEILLLFVIVSQGLEWLCMYIEVPEAIYRLLCIRYMFLIYFGYLWVTNHMSRTLTTRQLVVSIISLGILLGLYYTTGTLKPIFHDSNWRVFHWICYFYAGLLLPWILWKLYAHIPLKIRKIIEEIGTYSYDIFLMQMMVFTLFPKLSLLGENVNNNWIIFFVSTIFLSIVPIVIWKRYKEILKLVF